MALRSFDAPPDKINFSKKTSAHLEPVAVFLVILFTILVLALIGRGMYDVDRLFNPNYSTCTSEGLSGASCNSYYYYWNRDLHWSYITVPLGVFFLILAINVRKRKHLLWHKAFFSSFVVLTSTMAGVTFYYVAHFLFTFQRMIAWYFLFGAGVILILSLILYIDRKNKPSGELNDDGEDDGGY